MFFGSCDILGANCNKTDTDLFLGFVGTAWAFSIIFFLESGIIGPPGFASAFSMMKCLTEILRYLAVSSSLTF